MDAQLLSLHSAFVLCIPHSESVYLVVLGILEPLTIVINRFGIAITS